MTVIHSEAHTHEIDLDAALDYLNTRGLQNGRPMDRLETASDAATWFARAGLIHPDQATGWDDADLDRARLVRDALREVVDSVVEARAVDPQAVATVNDAIRRTPPVALEASPEGLAVVHRHVGRPVDEALARLADPIVHELADGRPERLRICANDTCRWAFYYSSPAGRRRWCEMRVCGNRAKARRHRERLREIAAEPDAAAGSEAAARPNSPA